MKEIKAIIKAYDSIDKSTTSAALATVVRVEGSSYRRTGARMLVMDNGIWVGGISGGCLEGDALKRARVAIAKSASTLITYDTTEEDAYQIGVGLGCNGIIDVLFTPLNYNDKNNPVEVLKAALALSRQTHVLITFTKVEEQFTKLKAGDLIKFDGPESLLFLQNEPLQTELTQAIHHQLVENKSATCKLNLQDEGVIECFIEILAPEVNMVIMGFQYDVYPLARLVKEIGWRVTIAANPQKLNNHLIAIADEVLAPENIASLHVDQYTVIILMSHDYKTDKYNLPKALATSTPYIGILGPKSRSERIIEELTAEDFAITPEDQFRIYAPIGLDIGAVSPEEIALSLVAEVRAVLSKREGGFLRLRLSSIHERG